MRLYQSVFSRFTILGLIITTLAISPCCAQVSQSPDRAEVIRIFKRGVALNEELKGKINKVSKQEYSKIYKEMNKFDDEELPPKLSDCIELLSSGKDNELAVEFFNLLISYSNSADESLSFALGKVFVNNPYLITETFAKFSKTEQTYLYNTLLWGWLNIITTEDIPDKKILNSLKALRSLNKEAFR